MGVDILERLRSGEGLADLPVVVLVAHPDDEVIGVGGRLPRLRRVHVVYATDGAPADHGGDGLPGAPRSREAYRDARAREAEAGLALAGVPPERAVRLGFTDQQASLDMAALTRAVLALARDLRPAAVVTHPFENGHPDHDAAALAAHVARRLLADAGEPAPELVEFACYHDPDGSGRMGVQEFLPGADAPAVVAALDAAERRLKRRMFAAHATQRHVLRHFAADRERYRLAPAYDFLAAPHPWRPLYEQWFDTMTRERWQRLAAETLAGFGLGGERL